MRNHQIKMVEVYLQTKEMVAREEVLASVLNLYQNLQKGKLLSKN
jgi:hypothetical protein